MAPEERNKIMRHDSHALQGEKFYHVRIEAETHGFHIGLREVWQYRELVLLLTKKTFTMTYQQTVLGPLWIILNPAISSLLHFLVFGCIARIGTGKIPAILFYFVSSAVWELLSYSMMSNAETFLSNAYLFSKVYFPRLSVPFSNMIVSLLKFLIQMIIIIPLTVIYLIRGDIHPSPAGLLLLPLLLLQMSILGMSVGILFSSLTTRYRDLMHLVHVGISIWMYGSAVVYPLSSMSPGVLRTLISINPVTQIMEFIRSILLGEGVVSYPYYLAGVALTILLFVIGCAVFTRVERTFEDTI